MTSPDRTEQIARIVDPGAWKHENNDSEFGVAEHRRRKGRRSTANNRARAILSLLQQGEPEGFVRVPKAALDWLNGSGPDHEGKWFGEVEDALPQSKHPRKYFWRSHFRKICNAITGKPTFYTYNKSQRALVASPSPLPPAPGAEMGERKDHLADLVGRFSVALLEKLRAAEKKYGYDNGWLYDDWAHDLRRDLRKHIDKGDPLDVAAYCAFAWHHGWSTSSSGTSYRRAVLEEAAKLVKSFWITAEYDHIGDADVLESVCMQASEAILDLDTTPPAEGETK